MCSGQDSFFGSPQGQGSLSPWTVELPAPDGSAGAISGFGDIMSFANGPAEGSPPAGARGKRSPGAKWSDLSHLSVDRESVQLASEERRWAEEEQERLRAEMQIALAEEQVRLMTQHMQALEAWNSMEEARARESLIREAQEEAQRRQRHDVQLAQRQAAVRRRAADQDWSDPLGWSQEEGWIQDGDDVYAERYLTPEDLVGDWVDLEGNAVKVFSTDAFEVRLVAAVSRASRGDLHLTVSQTPTGSWRCGSFELDPWSSSAKQLTWWAGAGNTSVWVRAHR